MNECYPIVGKRVNLNGISFFIHGIVHENPLISISNEFKKDLAKKFEDYPTICEDGITSWIPGAKSFNETNHFRLNKSTPLNYFIFFRGYFYNRFIAKTHNTPLAKKVRALRKNKDLEIIRKELFASYYSEPQGMNLLIEKTCGGTLKNPKGEFPLRIKRYLYEAKEAVDYAKKNNLKELHIIVGCAHELPLEYLLNTKRNI